MAQATLASATVTAAAIARGDASSTEVTAALLEQIEEQNPVVNALSELRAEEALQEAKAADAAVPRGGELGPLHGVPISVKDALNVSAMHTTWGNPDFADYVADWDATVVRRLRQAGAVLVGKSNVAFMLADFGQTSNPVYGTTRNPHDLDYAPGGSSGGGAAALAAGLTYLEYGSDLAGSVRIPAASCGVYGLKPTVGVVPLTGFAPPRQPTEPSEMAYLNALGPMARSAEDLRTALRVTGGPEAPTAYTWTLPAPRQHRLAEYRVGVVLDHPRAPVSNEVGGALSATVDTIARAGATIVPGWPDGIDANDGFETFGFHLGAFFAYVEPGPSGIDFGEFVDREHRRMAARAAWDRYFREVDVFICPVSFTTAIAHDDRPFDQRSIATDNGPRAYSDLSFWTSHASLPGLPSVSAPIGFTTGGLPIATQIIGPRYEDDTAITFAELLAPAIGWEGSSRPDRALGLSPPADAA